VGIIMGANVGTTITSWLLSLSGIQSDNLFVRMLKPSSFAPILAMIGIILYMFTKKEKHKNVGGILLGFAILMTGMDTMSSAVAPLKNIPAFTNLFTMFTNPFLGMVVGAILTAVIQSSSASVGILQALCATGAVPYGAAIPIIMGQNIGTCVTAMISSIGASKNAKRAAFIHLYFNVIGTALFMIVFYLIHAVHPFAFLGTSANAAGIAVVHSVFNIAATVVLLPFAGGLEKLACLTVRDREPDETENSDALHSLDSLQSENDLYPSDNLQLLDERFLEKPSLAMQHCKEVTVKMGELAQESIHEAVKLLDNYSAKRADYVLRLENRIDQYEDRLGQYLMQVSSRDLSEEDSYWLSVLLHCINDLERISDHAVNVVESAQEMEEKKISFSESASREMHVLADAVRNIVEMSLEVLKKEDMEAADRVEPLEEVIDRLSDEVKAHHIERLRNGKCTIEMGFVLSDLTINLERVADHCSNIAVSILETPQQKQGAHAYLQNRSQDEQFKKNFDKYRKMYCIK
jgi:phosphate:Na+ symporter